MRRSGKRGSHVTARKAPPGPGGGKTPNGVLYSTDLLIERISKRIETLQTNAKAVSLKAGLAATYVSDLLAKRSIAPGAFPLKAIATALDCSLAYLFGEEDDAVPPTVKLLDLIPVVATIEAGAFRAMPKDGELTMIAAPKSRLHPTATHFAVRIFDTGMDACADGPLMPGMYAHCVDLSSANLTVETGRLYCLRRTQDNGKTWEWLIRRARVHGDRVVFVAESRGAHPRIEVRGTPTIDSAIGKRKARDGVVVAGLVFGAEISFEK